MVFPRYVLYLLLCLVASCANAASPSLDYLFPPALKRGSNTVLTVGGKFDPWPVSAWADCSGLSFRAETNSGKFAVEVASDAPIGPHLLRIYNQDGVSAPRCFVITRDQDVIEKEPNDSFKQAQPIEKLPATIDGRLEKSGDVDSFAVRVEAGKWLVARVDAFVLGSPVDAVLHLLDEQGVRLAFNHDSARSLDPFLAHKIENSGIYILQVAGFAHPPAADVRYTGSPAIVYRLSVTDGPFVHHFFPVGVQRGQKLSLESIGWNLEGLGQKPEQAFDASDVPGEVDQVFAEAPGVNHRLPLSIGDNPERNEIEPNNTIAQAQPVSPPCTVNGCISHPGDEDRFRFSAEKDQRFELRIQSASQGFPLDATLTVSDSAGAQLGRADDDRGPDPKLSWTAPTNGSYIVTVNDLFHKGGEDFVYRLSIAPPKSDFSVTASEHAIRLEPGKTNEFKIDVTRVNGHTNALAVEIANLPDGVSAKLPEVLGKSGEVKISLMAEGTAKPANQPIRVFVRAVDSSVPKARPARFDLKGKDSPGNRLINSTDQIWLTVVSPAKEPSSTKVESKK